MRTAIQPQLEVPKGWGTKGEIRKNGQRGGVKRNLGPGFFMALNT